MRGFEYPTAPHVRRHGPDGYKNYSSFRDWLRDEFTFRCVYCLHREQWYSRSGTFHIEHSTPVAVNPGGKCVYANLLYACATCNLAKLDILSVPDPCKVAFGDCLSIQANGTVRALNADGRKLCDVLLLNSKPNVDHRRQWMRILKIVEASDQSLYEELMGFPQDIPDLRNKRAPQNSKPGGVKNCYFAKRERGELPPTYS